MRQDTRECAAERTWTAVLASRTSHNRGPRWSSFAARENSSTACQVRSSPNLPIESFAKILSAGNRELLRVIAEQAPGSLDELARITGRAKSNLSRTLRTMEGYGLVRLERGERGRITPTVLHDRVELDLPLTWSRRAG